MRALPGMQASLEWQAMRMMQGLLEQALRETRGM
jgi:hypothetical protein